MHGADAAPHATPEHPTPDRHATTDHTRTDTADIRAFVLLPFSQGLVGGDAAGLARWAERHARGLTAEATPYGYHRAREHGIAPVFSVDPPTGKALSVLRSALLRAAGMDLVHVWRNRARIADADIVWTHTEREHLAVLALQRAGLAARRPVIAQSVWLFEHWERLSGLRRAAYRALLRRAAALTTLSPVNRDVARRALGRADVAMIPFGIDPALFDGLARPVDGGEQGRPARLLGIGNDRDRDWRTFADALAAAPDLAVEAEILTPRAEALARRLPDDPRLTCRKASLAEVREAYAAADIAVLPLRPNRHASGVTVLLEAVAAGVPVIATATGGLDAYLDAAAVTWVEPGDQDDLARAVAVLLADPERRRRQAEAARRQVAERGLTSADYVAAHCTLTRRLLGRSEGARAGDQG
ncbi:MAG: glycosyltransferase [Azospirillaceae bacterium]